MGKSLRPVLAIVAAVAACVAIVWVVNVVNTLGITPEERMSNTLVADGLVPVHVKIDHDGYVESFSAYLKDNPSCTVTGSESHSSEQLILNGFEPSWYPRQSGYSYAAPGMPTWLPAGMTITEVIHDHPEICQS